MKANPVKFVGFYYFKEWDGTLSKVSVQRERGDLADFLKHNIESWYILTYSDGVTHSVPDWVWTAGQAGQYDPNVYSNGIQH